MGKVYPQGAGVGDVTVTVNCDGGGGSGIDLSAIPEYDSMALALVSLGENEFFRWTELNTDGVSSPEGSQVGITKQ